MQKVVSYIKNCKADKKDNLRENMICIVLLVYEEAENLNWILPQILENIKKTTKDFHILVVDSEKSSDNSSEICEQFHVQYVRQEYPGFGGAYKTAIKYATGDSFLILDSDGQHSPQDIPRLTDMYAHGKYDIVIGSRYVKGGTTDESLISVTMSRILNYIFRMCLGIKAYDISTNFRIYNLKQLKQCHLECTNFDVLQEILLKMKLNNPSLKIGEIPIALNHRAYGESKRKWLPFIISYGMTLLKLTRLRIKYRKH